MDTNSSVGRAEVCGPRGYMEDVTVVAEGNTGVFLGVFDGHGGKAAACQAAYVLPDAFFAEGRDEGAMERAYETAQEEMPEISGTCAATLFYFYSHRPELVYGWIGDCRILVIGKNGEPPRHLTEDHRSEANLPERNRVLEAGGHLASKRGHEYVMNKSETRGLMITRSLGDRNAERQGILGVLHRPEVGRYLPGPKDKWVVLCSDGISDTLSPERIADIVHESPTSQGAAEGLCEMALQNGGEDNVSAIVLKLD